MGFSLRFPFTVFTPDPDFAAHSWGWGVGVFSSRSHPPKPSPSDAGCVPAPGPGLELGKAKLVVGSGTSDPAAPTLRLGQLPGGVGGSLQKNLGEEVGARQPPYQRDTWLMGEAADRFLGEQAPSPHKFLLRISEHRDILVRASSLRPIPAPPRIPARKQK